MRIISFARLREFYSNHPNAETPLKSWRLHVKNAHWRTPTDVLTDYNTADILGDNRVVFNIGGNKYRLVARINYKSQSVYIRFIGTHNEYDKIDARTC